MQALFFMALFGVFFATIAGLIGNASLNSIQLLERQIADTKQYFEDIAFVINQYEVMQQVRMPEFADAEDYLEMEGVARGVNWVWNEPGKDPWGNDIWVVAVHQPLAIVGVGGTVQPYATAFVLASPGQDLTYDPNLKSDIEALSSTSPLTDVLRIEAPADTDDIVYTFSTARALENRWDMVAWNMKKLGEIYLSLYQQKYADTDFEGTLQDFYKESLDDYFGTASAGTSFVLNEEMLNQWKNPDSSTISSGVRTNLTTYSPNMATLRTELNTLEAGDNSYMTFIESNKGTTGLELTAISWADSGSGIHDRLELSVAASGNTGKSWQNESGRLTYTIELGN